MKKQYFVDSVKFLTCPDDFQENKQKLREVEPWLHETFLKCLKHGGYIIPSIRAVNKIDEISKRTALTSEECIDLASEFRWINALLDMEPEPPQRVEPIFDDPS